MTRPVLHRSAMLAFLAAACALLSGCLLMPAGYVATLEIRQDGRFAFTYVGRIAMVSPGEGLDRLGEAREGDAQRACHDDDGEGRACTQEELAGHRALEQARQAAIAGVMFGGLDIEEIGSPEEFARALERQAGWDKVTHVGEGVFEVEFAVSGVLTHDFAFPTIEHAPHTNPFVQATLRDAAVVRVRAPGLTARGNPLLAMLGAGDAAGEEFARELSGEDAGFPLPRDIGLFEGTFRVITDGRILANNTDEGPAGDPRGQLLEWRITPRTGEAPSALIELGR